ncbi:hypothetical protein LCGC14_3141890 [marine sediment metagenome]|uniref:Uncharacterized protein n=1 Tax=marine sediment metagenome TaxID=412755 RepID=A0A0F8WKI9_9ZZZZ
MENFNPTVRCPYCRGVNRPSISGWGRVGLNNRSHTCKHCEKDYVVVIYVETSKELEIVDGHISNIKGKIKYQKARTREIEKGLINTGVEVAKEYIRVEASSGGNRN